MNYKIKQKPQLSTDSIWFVEFGLRVEYAQKNIPNKYLASERQMQPLTATLVV